MRWLQVQGGFLLLGVVACTLAALAVLTTMSTHTFSNILNIIATTLGAIGGVAAVLFLVYQDFQSKSLRAKIIEQIEVRAEKEPQKTKFAWDLARVKLEAYFDRNLSQ